jgi:amino acid permease
MATVTLEKNAIAHEILEADVKAEDLFDSSQDDQLHMQRMGKTQEMKRVFRQVSLISFTAICMSTWEWAIMSNTQGLTDGGRAGLFWGYIWTFVGYGFLAASLAEMAAMAPTA